MIKSYAEEPEKPMRLSELEFGKRAVVEFDRSSANWNEFFESCIVHKIPGKRWPRMLSYRMMSIPDFPKINHQSTVAVSPRSPFGEGSPRHAEELQQKNGAASTLNQLHQRISHAVNFKPLKTSACITYTSLSVALAVAIDRLFIHSQSAFNNIPNSVIMTETQQKAKCITLKGSAELVRKYLLYGINSILYQRGIYPPETFEPAEHFGLYFLMSTDEKIKTFLETVLGQVQDWLVERKVQQVTLVITNVNTKEVLEKWDFKVNYEGQQKNGAGDANGLPDVGTKDVKMIQKEIREVLRQITGTVSFLPLLDCLCSFDILTYTVPDCGIPKEWDETQPVFIANSQEVQLRSFSTSIHKMDTIVSYKNT